MLWHLGGAVLFLGGWLVHCRLLHSVHSVQERPPQSMQEDEAHGRSQVTQGTVPLSREPPTPLPPLRLPLNSDVSETKADHLDPLLRNLP